MYTFIRFPHGKSKAVTFSYDDGTVADLKLAEIFDKYNLKGTFNLNGKDYNRFLSDDDIKNKILAKGHEVAIHGDFHKAPGFTRPVEGIRDVLDCRIFLEQRFDMIIRGMAYPDSGITKFSPSYSYQTVRDYLKDLDIKYARTLGGDNNSFSLPVDWYAWMPTAHHNNPEIFEWIDEFLAIKTQGVYRSAKYPRLFYIWGHSYEFERKNNWDRIEEICRKFSESDDVWAATNIEIYDYINAYNSLSFSADGSIVYNPTLLTVWFDFNDVIYSIKSGETIKIK